MGRESIYNTAFLSGCRENASFKQGANATLVTPVYAEPPHVYLTWGFFFCPTPRQSKPTRVRKGTEYAS